MRDFNPSPSVINRITWKLSVINRGGLNNIINQFDPIIDIYRIIYPTNVEYIIYLSVPGTFTKIVCIMNHKTNLKSWNSTRYVLQLILF